MGGAAAAIRRAEKESPRIGPSSRMSMYDALMENGVFCQGGLLTSLGINVGQSFMATWVAFTALALVTVFATSGPLFYLYYWPTQVTYEKWQRKSNPRFPSVEKVRDEIVQMCKGVFCGVTCPAASVWLAYHGRTQAYCGTQGGQYGLVYHVATFFAVMIISDFWEFYYHYLGHVHKPMWNQHKHHHVFFNPSPFAVIADEFVDQFFRASPLLLFPLVAPINIDLMFFEYLIFFYVYGCYLHWGYELDWLDAHNPIANTAFQHYCHHAHAIMGKPYHCGFFFKIWDNLFGSVWKGECFCAKCERKNGKRTLEQFKMITVPDYNELLRPSFWFKHDVLSGTTSKDKREEKHA